MSGLIFYENNERSEYIFIIPFGDFFISIYNNFGSRRICRRLRLLAAESSIHALRAKEIKISFGGRMQTLQKMKLLGAECYGIMMPDTIQP
jgi:hypothetical protein